MNRLKLKKKKKISPLTYILILILLFIISLIFSFKYIGKKLENKVDKYAEIQAKKIISLVINKSINKKIISKFNTNDIFIEKNNIVDFNSKVINNILYEVNLNLKNNLYNLEKGNIKSEIIINNRKKLKKGIIYEIPTGIVFNNSLLSNIGPKIPVKLELLGDALTEVTTNIKDYGINNAIIEIKLKVTINEQVILPFSSNSVSVTEEFPLAIKLIQGNIPNYYSSGNIPLYIDK